MVITHFEEGSFRLQSGEVSILLDPQNNRLKSDVVIRTAIPREILSMANDIPSGEVIFPGEYEIKGIEISGIPVLSESNEKILKTVYRVIWEDVKIVFLGSVTKEPDAELLEKLDEPDVLFFNVGPKGIAAETAAKVIKELDPALVVPGFEKNANDLLRVTGQKAELEEKFVFKKKELVGFKNKIILLKPTL